jgi:hypothetical protein
LAFEARPSRLARSRSRARGSTFLNFAAPSRTARWWPSRSDFDVRLATGGGELPLLGLSKCVVSLRRLPALSLSIDMGDARFVQQLLREGAPPSQVDLASVRLAVNPGPMSAAPKCHVQGASLRCPAGVCQTHRTRRSCRFSRLQRLDPRIALRACCIPQPIMRFTRFWSHRRLAVGCRRGSTSRATSIRRGLLPRVLHALQSLPPARSHPGCRPRPCGRVLHPFAPPSPTFAPCCELSLRRLLRPPFTVGLALSPLVPLRRRRRDSRPVKGRRLR